MGRVIGLPGYFQDPARQLTSQACGRAFLRIPSMYGVRAPHDITMRAPVCRHPATFGGIYPARREALGNARSVADRCLDLK